MSFQTLRKIPCVFAGAGTFGSIVYASSYCTLPIDRVFHKFGKNGDLVKYGSLASFYGSTSLLSMCLLNEAGSKFEKVWKLGRCLPIARQSFILSIFCVTIPTGFILTINYGKKIMKSLSV